MRNSDLIVRVACALTFVTTLWNGFAVLLYIAMLIWVLIGILWFIPLFAVMIQFVLAIVFLVLGHNKAAIVMPLLGLFTSVCTFNIIGGMLETVNLILVIASYVMRANEDAALTA